MKRLEKQGVSFGSDEERADELKRLVALSDDAFAATEAAYDRLARAKNPEESKQSGDDQDTGKQKAKASHGSDMQSDADLRPHEVDDHKQSLEERLTQGFMAAYEARSID